MNWFSELLNNAWLLCPVSSWLVAQVLKVIINAEAGTMTLVRSDATGNFGTGGVQQAEYTYEYDGSTVTVNNVSGQTCTCVFGADGAPTSITWGAAQFINFAVA